MCGMSVWWDSRPPGRRSLPRLCSVPPACWRWQRCSPALGKSLCTPDPSPPPAYSTPPRSGAQTNTHTAQYLSHTHYGHDLDLVSRGSLSRCTVFVLSLITALCSFKYFILRAFLSLFLAFLTLVLLLLLCFSTSVCLNTGSERNDISVLSMSRTYGRIDNYFTLFNPHYFRFKAECLCLKVVSDASTQNPQIWQPQMCNPTVNTRNFLHGEWRW